MNGRGGWTKIGMPPNGTVFYQYIEPEHVGWRGSLPDAELNDRAVNWGVKSLQRRVNELGFGTTTNEPLVVNGVLDLRTALGIGWMQSRFGLKIDGRVGQTTAKHAFWPVIRDASGGGRWTRQMKQIVGAIADHESHYDPGAVGYETPDDLGMVQINGPANPSLSEADRFDYRKAFTWALDRIKAAIETPGYTTDAAIASYFIPAVAAYWVKSGTETYPSNPDLNDKVLAFVDYVKAWTPGF